MLALIVACALVATSAACGSDAAGQTATEPAASVADERVAASDLPQTVQSDDGREVVVEDVSRIVSLAGSVTEVLFDLGLGANIVGRDISTTLAEASEIPLVTQGHELSAESVLSLRPTLVLAPDDAGPPEALEQIRNVGIPVVVFPSPDSVDGIAARIEAIATAVGMGSGAAAVIDATQAELAALQDEIPADAEVPRVAFLYLRGHSGVYLLGGPGAGTDSLIEAAGGLDAGTEIGLDEEFSSLTSEALVEAAPDAFLVTTTGLESVGGIDGLLELPGVAQTPAGQNRRVVAVEDGLLFSFGSRTPDAIASIIAQLYAP